MVSFSRGLELGREEVSIFTLSLSTLLSPLVSYEIYLQGLRMDGNVVIRNKSLTITRNYKGTGLRSALHWRGLVRVILFVHLALTDEADVVCSDHNR